MKHFAVLTMAALLGLGSLSRAADDTPPATPKAPETHAPAGHPVEQVEKSNLSYFQLSEIGLLTVIAILLAMGLSQVSAIKAGIDKIASK